ncbi:hypothetical protein GCM10010376_10800 [Streptomyces violaceusniger]
MPHPWGGSGSACPDSPGSFPPVSRIPPDGLRTSPGRAPIGLPDGLRTAPEQTPDGSRTRSGQPPGRASLRRAHPRPGAVQARVPPPRVAHAVARAAESTEIILV